MFPCLQHDKSRLNHHNKHTSKFSLILSSLLSTGLWRLFFSSRCPEWNNASHPSKRTTHSTPPHHHNIISHSNNIWRLAVSMFRPSGKQSNTTPIQNRKIAELPLIYTKRFTHEWGIFWIQFFIAVNVQGVFSPRFTDKRRPNAPPDARSSLRRTLPVGEV